jgi:hypothetical protein
VSPTDEPLRCGDVIHVSRVGDDQCICGKHRRAFTEPLPQQPDADRLRAAFMALVAKWREDACGVDAMGYSQQADRIRDCADELEAAGLATQPKETP